MEVFLVPQENKHHTTFEYEQDLVTVTRNDIIDTFDFSQLQEGDIVEDIETTLEFNPIISASRIGGILKLKLLNHYKKENVSDEILNPKWVKV